MTNLSADSKRVHRQRGAVLPLAMLILLVLSAVLLGLASLTGQEAAFGTPERWSFYLYPAAAGDGIVGARMHVAFGAPSRAAVEQVHAAALAAGAHDVFTPRERPDISPTYYGAMFRSADGHAIEVLTNA